MTIPIGLTRCAGVAAIGLAFACVGDKATAPVVADPATIVGTVVASPPNAILAIGGSVQLDAEIRSLTGAALTDVDSIRYVLPIITDTIRITLSPTGLVTARAETGEPVRIHVLVYNHGTGKADDVLVQVTAAALTGLTLSIQPVAPDSAKLAKGTYKPIDPVISNATTGESVASPFLKITTKGTDKLRMAGYEPDIVLPGPDGPQVASSTPVIGNTPNYIYGLAGVGTAWVHAEVSAYGTLLRDSVLYTLSYPYEAEVQVVSVNQGVAIGGLPPINKDVTLAPGATVTFRNQLVRGLATVPVTYTFEDPSTAVASTPPSDIGGASGNVSGLTRNQQSLRRFMNPGVYRWTMTVGGNVPPVSGISISGTVTIK